MVDMRQLKVLMHDELKDKICIVIGTRPGIIKFSPVMRELEKRDRRFFVIHTGQHYSYRMDKVFLDELNLPEPKYKLNLSRSKCHGVQTAKMLVGIEKALLKEKPRMVLVGGDANTNLAGALAARKLHIYLGHIEAGLRSNDWMMPEEHNRVIIDHISDFLFAPTEKAKKNLIEDNVKGKIFVTGNTIVDAVEQNLEIAKRKAISRFSEFNLKSEDYFLFSLHREENVDFKQNLTSIISGIRSVSEFFNCQIVFPIHPRTKKRLKYFRLGSAVDKIKNLRLIDPVGYLDFLNLLYHSRLVLTDSGGVQEESCILRVPCVTLRDNTERPETVDVGANFIAGVKSEKLLEGTKIMLKAKRRWKNPFGENVSKKIIDITEEFFGAH